MLLFPAIAGAQALPFTAAETDAASLGTAGADLTQTGSIAYASFSNAAAIPFSDAKMDVAAGYNMWQPSSVGSSMINVGAAYNMNNKLGVAVGFLYGMNPAYDIADASGAVKGQFKPSDMHMNVGVAYRFLPFLSVGAGNFNSLPFTSALAADVYAMAQFSGLKVTAGVANVGTSVKAKNGTAFSLPTSVAFGAGYEMSFADVHSVDVLLDADYYFCGSFAAAAGATYTFKDLVVVRAGYRYGGASPIPSYASVGAGVKFAGAKLDLAYLIGSSAMKNTLAITVGYSF